jgi:hypothetical protein
MRMRSYRYLGDNMELLGGRLDGARAALARSKTDWAKQHWQNVIECLEAQWRLLPVLHDCDAVFTDRPRWRVHYDFIEGHLKEDSSWVKNLYNHSPSLDWSWDNARNERLARSQ